MNILTIALPLFLTALPALAQSATRLNQRVAPEVDTESEVATGDPLLVAFEREEVEFARLKADTRISQSGLSMPKDTLLEADYEIGSGRKEYCKGFKTAL
ncbi:MAG TPA: hypothetical protein VMT16_11125, partial [Thermoanaerobaculia bacterium]|nr:hypothetical protein [Thermoanaerobaculia bacterium]